MSFWTFSLKSPKKIKSFMYAELDLSRLQQERSDSESSAVCQIWGEGSTPGAGMWKKCKEFINDEKMV